MRTTTTPHIEDSIARCRIILSVVALVAVFIDPTEPLLSRWIPLSSGHFTIDPYVLIVMGAHLAYSVVAYAGVTGDEPAALRLAQRTTWLDVAFGAAIAFLTEGVTSPFYPFFAFAVIVAGFRSGLRQALLVTAVSVSLYLCLILVSAPGNFNIYIMRPAYIGITGYLVGYLGQQRLELQKEIRQLEAAEQRHRIARDLHDGFVQALAGINLRIESCRRSLGKSREADALAELTELQQSINREYDDLRAFMRSLAGIDVSPTGSGQRTNTRLSLHADLTGSAELVDHVLQIVREGISNVRRHARADSALVEVQESASKVQIRIQDDGCGFAGDSTPWSIVSRVHELGGQLEMVKGSGAGAHLSIVLPQS